MLSISQIGCGGGTSQMTGDAGNADISQMTGDAGNADSNLSIADAATTDAIATRDGFTDAAPVATDAALDLAPVAQTIACGAASCATPTNLCCTDDEGTTGTCAPTAPQTLCANGGAWLCDGPEDCPATTPAKSICCEDEQGARCTDESGCIRNAITYELCHADADCTLYPSTTCCPAATGAVYRRCAAACN